MNNHAQLPPDFKVVIGGLLNDPGKTVEVTQSGLAEIPELACSEHEEADTRMFAHAAYCVEKDAMWLFFFKHQTQIYL